MAIFRSCSIDFNHRFDESTFRRQRKRARIEETENEENEEIGDGEDNGEDEEETAIDLGYDISFILYNARA